MDRKGIAKPGHGVGQKRRGLTLERDNTGNSAQDDIVGRLGDIQEHENGEVPVPADRSGIDPRIRHLGWRRTRTGRLTLAERTSDVMR